MINLTHGVTRPLAAILLALIVTTSSGGVSAEPNPGGIAFPADFVPQAGDFDDQSVAGQFMGLAGVRGRPLKERNGTPAIYIVSVREDEESLKAGDVITALSGNFQKLFLKNPIMAFKSAVVQAQEGGAPTFIRWRNGASEEVTLKVKGSRIPDLTAGGEHDPALIDWNLGATGAKGWMWSIPHKSTEGATQIYVTTVDPKSPADGILSPGDVILGADGKTFSRDARKEMANAITAAETPEKNGQLALTVWNAGKKREVTLALNVMGCFSETPVADEIKAQRIIAAACAHLLKKGVGGGVNGDVSALGLLATGREDVMPMVREHVQKVAADGKNLQFRQNMETWRWGYHNLLLTEYYLATHDESVMPAIREYSTKIALGQSVNGNWGHAMCVTYLGADGVTDGICPGYGALNQAGLPCMISLALAVKCGITNEPILLALNRGSEFFKFYVDRGAVPYGDHSPQSEAHEDNGKNSLTAVLFDLLGDETAATFFTKLTLASYNEREGGHTGNYFSLLWGPLGAARGGDVAATGFMKRMEWFYDLERQWQGNFQYQGKPGMMNTRNAENQYLNWDCTGARLLAYTLPLKKLYITGKGRTLKDFTGPELAEAVDAGALVPGDYSRLSSVDLLDKLGNWSPAVRSRAARALEGMPDNVVPQLIAMLDSPNRYARYGACQGLRFAGRASDAAADAIIAKGLESSDEVMLFYAMRAFSSYNMEMGLAGVANRALPAMLKRATEEGPGNLSMRTKNEWAFQLFYSGNAQNIKSLARNGEGILQMDGDLVVKSVRALLKVTNGGSRSSVAVVYDKLTDEQLKLLWKDIYQATREVAPADIMFSAGVRQAGIKLMAKHHMQEGLDTAAWYVTHGGRNDAAFALDLILNQYGGHAKCVIPQLEAAVEYFVAAKNKKSEAKAQAVRETIKRIEAAPVPPWQMVSIKEYL